MDAFKAAIVNTIGPRSKRRSSTMVSEVGSQGAVLDPRIQSLTSKVTLLRRVIAKYECFKEKAIFSLTQYLAKFDHPEKGMVDGGEKRTVGT